MTRGESFQNRYAPGAVLQGPWPGPSAQSPPRPSPMPLRPARSRWAFLSAVDLDAVFGFLIFEVMLFSLQLGTLGAAALVLLTAGYVAVRRRRLWEILAPRAILFLVPALAVLSVGWSEAPQVSGKLGVELLITVLAAVMLAGAQKPRAVLRGLATAFFVYTVVALMLGHTTAVGNDGEQAFSGLSDGKNLLADIAATGVILSAGVALTSLQRNRILWCLGAAAAALVEFYAVTAAHSAGAVLGLVFGLFAFFALALVYRMGPGIRAILAGFLLICLTVGALSYRWLSVQLIQLGADLFSKDTTLTGRTYLWYRAQELIHEKPVLGRGFYAFWLQGNIDAEGLWRYAGIQTRGGFTFHNTPVEILVQLGWLGLILVGVVATLGIAAVMWRFVTRPTLTLCLWTGLLLYELVRSPIEVIGIAPFYFSTALTFAGFAYALSRPPARVRAPVVPPGQRAPLHRPRRVLDPEPVAINRRLLAAPDPRDP